MNFRDRHPASPSAHPGHPLSNKFQGWKWHTRTPWTRSKRKYSQWCYFIRSRLSWPNKNTWLFKINEKLFKITRLVFEKILTGLARMKSGHENGNENGNGALFNGHYFSRNAYTQYLVLTANLSLISKTINKPNIIESKWKCLKQPLSNFPTFDWSNFSKSQSTLNQSRDQC